MRVAGSSPSSPAFSARNGCPCAFLVDPRYDVEPLGPVDGRLVMLEVRRVEPGAAIAAGSTGSDGPAR
jgi:hypothetical protein